MRNESDYTGIHDIADLITAQAEALSQKLQAHRLKLFPPSAQKPLRQFGIAEAAKFLGISTGYLKNLSLESKGPVPALNGSRRRFYTAEQIGELRVYLEKYGRPNHLYLPHRRGGEHLQIIAVVNFKGGSCKTTTATHLAQHLALRGHRVLAIDLDPQASLSALFGLQPEFDLGPNESLYGAIRYDQQIRPLSQIIRRTNFPGLDLVPGAIEVSEFEYDTPTVLAKSDGRETATYYSRLETALADVRDQYDVVIVDCPPQLGYLTLAALCTATAVLITVHPQMLDVMSMCQFLAMMAGTLGTMKRVGADLRLDWMRYLITRFEPGDGPQTQMVAFMRSLFGDYVLKHPMLKSVAISDAGMTKQTLYEIERKQFTTATYDRAMESLDAVNWEIEELIHEAWGRESPALPEKPKGRMITSAEEAADGA
ncbi:MAG: plasmid partitioning protein RepA [Acidobacteria bacterium]|nr:plasmid partitioning protein RepA [Acidobacteriota bacterium]